MLIWNSRWLPQPPSCFKCLLLWNCFSNFHQISHGAFFWKGTDSLFKRFHTIQMMVISWPLNFYGKVKFAPSCISMVKMLKCHFFQNVIWHKSTAFDANTLSQLFFLICIRFDSSLFTKFASCARVKWRHLICSVIFVFLKFSVRFTRLRSVLWPATCCECQDPRIQIPDPVQRLEQPCRLCMGHWIQGSAWWDGVWQARTICWGWENPRVCPSIHSAS